MGRAAGIALLGLAQVALGGVFDVGALHVPGVGLLLVAALATAWVRLAAWRLSVRRRLAATRVVEEAPLEVRVEVRAGGLPLPLATVADPLLAGPLHLPAGIRRRTVAVQARFARRGRVRVAPPALVVRDPLGLARRTVRGGRDDELLVLPRTEPIAFVAGRGRSGRPDRLAELLATAATEVDGLRPYREGTSAARIHWPALARGAGLMERRLRSEADARPLVVLDARAPRSGEALDAAVRAAASLCLALARAGGVALLLPGDRRPIPIDADLGAWPAAHERLALVAGGDGTPGPALGGAGVGRRPLVYVAARQLEALPERARTVARGTSALVVPGALAGRDAQFAVAGCSGYAVARPLRRPEPARARTVAP